MLEFLHASDEIILLDPRKVAAAFVANLDSQDWLVCIHHREWGNGCAKKGNR